MGSLFSKPDFADPVVLDEPEPLPTEVDEGVTTAREKDRKKGALAQGRSSTILTDPLGLTDEPLTTTSLLGG